LTLMIGLDGSSFVNFVLPAPFSVEVKLIEVSHPIKVCCGLSRC
jgi:hypothetical protein